MVDITGKQDRGVQAGAPETRERVCLVQAFRKVKIGEKCTVHFLGHCNMETNDFHRRCHGMKAIVVGLGNVGVDIKMEEGLAKGEVYVSVRPGVLVFDGALHLDSPDAEFCGEEYYA